MDTIPSCNCPFRRALGDHWAVDGMFGITWFTTEPHDNPSFESTFELERDLGDSGTLRRIRGGVSAACAVDGNFGRCRAMARNAQAAIGSPRRLRDQPPGAGSFFGHRVFVPSRRAFSIFGHAGALLRPDGSRPERASPRFIAAPTVFDDPIAVYREAKRPEGKAVMASAVGYRRFPLSFKDLRGRLIFGVS